MVKAIEIAYYMVDYAHKSEKGCLLSGFKMNSLLFLVQGYSLARLNRRAFKDKIHKNSYGAFIPEPHGQFRQYGCLFIPRKHVVTNPLYWKECNTPYYDKYEVCYRDKATAYATYMCDRLDKKTEEIIKEVYDTYCKMSIPALNDCIRSMQSYKQSDQFFDIDLMKIEFKDIIMKIKPSKSKPKKDKENKEERYLEAKIPRDETQANSKEFIGQIIDVFEDFLTAKGVEIKSEDDDDLPLEEKAIIFGEDYYSLEERLETLMKKWKVL